MITETIEINPNAKTTATPEINNQIIPRSRFADPVHHLFVVIRFAVWDHIVEKTICNMQTKIQKYEVNENYAAKYYYAPVSRRELLCLFTLRLFFRFRKENASIRSQFQDSSPHQQWSMSANKFSVSFL